MTLEAFFEKFDQFADAPDAVAKLRELVLELAVRGRLIPSGKANPSALSDPSAPFPIPGHWRWTTLGEVAEPCGQQKPDARFTYVDVGAIDNVRGRITDSVTQLEAADAPSRARKLVRPGSVLYATVRPYLRNVAIVERQFAPLAIVSTAFAVLHPRSNLDVRFLFYWLRSQSFQLEVTERMKGVAYPAISDSEFWRCPVPLPPLAEQKRIVAKVDELMALCDRLEAQQQEREARHGVLARASLARFADAPTPANLQFLFHPSYAISPADLRKTILTLAVQGRLVPQDPNDEASETTFPALRPLSCESSDGADIPNSWELCAYRSLTTLVTSGSRGWKEFYAQKGSVFVRTQNIKTDKLVLEDVAFVDLPKSVTGMRAQVLKDDILITITGANVTKAARVEEQLPEAYVSQHIALTRPRWSEMAEWLHLCFISHGSARGTLEQLAYGDKPGLNLNNIRDLVLPIPPFAEQRRIVAKVDELMAMVDQLEAQLAASRAMAANLLSAVVAELTSPEKFV